MTGDALERLTEFLHRHRRIAVLTGAGCSTASGIPDYRADDGSWKHARPVQYRDFMGNAATRQRYWARSFTGWERIRGARPNAAHLALAELDGSGRVSALITQNVDDLHRRAGSRRIIDLHGVLRRTRCVSCRRPGSRARYQSTLRAANPGWQAVAAPAAPDGDARLADDAHAAFVVPGCDACGGIVKPDVVFFGETVPRDRVDAAHAAIASSDALLVVGTSLMVYSGLRFVRQASANGLPIAIVNRGCTRADDAASLRLHENCCELLPAAIAGLEGDLAGVEPGECR